MTLKEQLLQSAPMKKASHWWYGLPDRDQDMLRLLAVAVALVFLYLVIWLPTQNFLKNARSDVQRQAELVAYIKQNEQMARELAARTNTASPTGLEGQSLLSAVGNSAKTFSIELRRFEPEGDNKMRVWLEKVPFNQVLLWLDDLQQKYGIQAEQISVDRDETPGVVTARLSLVVS